MLLCPLAVCNVVRYSQDARFTLNFDELGRRKADTGLSALGTKFVLEVAQTSFLQELCCNVFPFERIPNSEVEWSASNDLFTPETSDMFKSFIDVDVPVVLGAGYRDP